MKKDMYHLAAGKSLLIVLYGKKIRTLQITPAQLALDPSTASSVVVDPNNGQVLACVTYPGYDNNRLANTVDAEYYNQLLQDESLPLYNNATQQRTAPGSTFKPVTAAAGISEGVITPYSTITDRGSFEKVTPSPECWFYPNGTHGDINVSEAIRDSCNYFFMRLPFVLVTDRKQKKEPSLMKKRESLYWQRRPVILVWEMVLGYSLQRAAHS